MKKKHLKNKKITFEIVPFVDNGYVNIKKKRKKRKKKEKQTKIGTSRDAWISMQQEKKNAKVTPVNENIKIFI